MGPIDLQIKGIHAVYAAVALAALASSGCLVVAAGVAAGGAAGYVYCKGKVCQSYNAGFADTQAAVYRALAELAMPIESQEGNGASGVIHSRTADGERVRIHIETEASPIPSEGVVTTVCVRVATFGDQPVSERILHQVEAHLLATPNNIRPVPAAPAQLGPIQPIPVTAGSTEPPLAK